MRIHTHQLCYYTLIIINLAKSLGNEKKYAWDYLNHYEILGLEGDESITSEREEHHEEKWSYHPNRIKIKQKSSNGFILFDVRNRINQQQIKKAYRKQAQKYHPDKIKKGGNSGNAASKEEQNARFNKIAQAYQVLSNEEHREEYDYKLYYEETIFLKERLKEINRMDLWNEQDLVLVDVHESYETSYDYRNDIPILRVHRREEYENGMHRDWIQDFSYSDPPLPLRPPVLVREEISFRHDAELHNSNNPSKRNKIKSVPYELSHGQTATKLQSFNKLFRATLTHDCELIILRKPLTPGGTSSLVWSSRTYLLPDQHQQDSPYFPHDYGCYFTLHNNQLYVLSNTTEHQPFIVWSTPTPSLQIDVASTILILENDGALSIYTNSTTNMMNKVKTTNTNIQKLLSSKLITSTNKFINDTLTQSGLNEPPTLNYSTKASQLFNKYFNQTKHIPFVNKTVNSFHSLMQDNTNTISSYLKNQQLTVSIPQQQQNLQNLVVTHFQKSHDSFHKFISSLYHPNLHKQHENLACIWSTNDCTPFPILRMSKFLLINCKYRFMKVIHFFKELVEEEHTNNNNNPLAKFGKRIVKAGKQFLNDVFELDDDDDDDFLFDDDDDDFFDDDDDPTFQTKHNPLDAYFRRLKKTMNDRMDMPL